MDLLKTSRDIEQAAAKYAANAETYTGADGLLYCSKCHTPRQCKVVLFDTPRVVSCICKCEQAAQEAEQQARERQERARKIAKLREKGFNNDDIAAWRFDRDNGSNPAIMKVMHKYVNNFTEFKKKGKGLLLWGNVGTGKTFAAACIANALIDQATPCYMTNFDRIANKLMETYDGKQKYLDTLNGFDLLVIDDLGVERKTEYMQEIVYSVIDARYRAGLPMIITTNLTIEELKNPQSVTEARCYDRILERCHPVEIAGASQRRKKIIEEYAETKKILGL